MQKISIPMIGGMHVVTPNPWLILCQCLAILVATIIVALIVARYAAHHWHGDKKDVATGYAAISGVYALLLFGSFVITGDFFDLNFGNLNGFLVLLVLLIVCPTIFFVMDRLFFLIDKLIEKCKKK